MIRRFIKISDIQMSDDFHTVNADGSFSVNVQNDGLSHEDHRKGIDYMKKVIQDGVKTMPILVAEIEEREFIRLDGFKRLMAYKELGYDLIEAFVCAPEEYRRTTEVPFLNGKMRCYHGGQPFEVFSLHEGEERPGMEYDRVKFLYKGKHVRIEVCESIHVHWGEFGRYRLSLGRNDFVELAKAISNI